MSTKKKSDSQLIDDAGGTAEVARLCHVSMQAVSNWREEGIPDARRLFLKAVRPEVFGPVPAPAPSPAQRMAAGD